MEEIPSGHFDAMRLNEIPTPKCILDAKVNGDNIEQAVSALNQFTHNWCMNCAETEEQDALVFRCGNCDFAMEDGKCLIKIFKCKHLPDFKDFGCMGDL